MPTLIALDVSLSMRRTVLCVANGTDNLQNEQLTRHYLAVYGINTFLHYLQTNCKLEFASLVKKSHVQPLYEYLQSIVQLENEKNFSFNQRKSVNFVLITDKKFYFFLPKIFFTVMG